MKIVSIAIVQFLFVLYGCDFKNVPSPKSVRQEKNDPNEIVNFYSAPESEMVYSEFVLDSFKIFISLPSEYTKDTTSAFPLLLVLDANAYFESIVAELKLNSVTQDMPKSIVIGIGYKNFWTLDSLRDRDYTYPQASPEDEFRISGGAEKFKNFIDKELLAKIARQYRIDRKKITLMGHSLGGYFALYHMLHSLEKGEYSVRNYICVSPALAYGSQYLLNLEKKLGSTKNSWPFKLYVSTGSLEHGDDNENLFLKFQSQMEKSHYSQAKLKFIEFGNFDHMDSAMPGFMKGLAFVFEK
jgi:predicted alpha/beta superfamily hydrolase